MSRSILLIKIHTEDLCGSERLELRAVGRRGRQWRAGGLVLDILFGLDWPHLLLRLLAEAGLLLGPLNLVDAIVQTVLKKVSELDQISENLVWV